MAFYHYAIDGIFLSLHSNFADFTDFNDAFKCFQSYTRGSHPHLRFLAWNDKLTVFIGHSTCDESCVGNREQLDIGKHHRIIVFIDELADKSSFGLVHTFHGNDTVAHTNRHRIKAHNVANGIQHRTVVKTLGDGEIFQFVIYKTDMIARRGTVEIDECLRHRYVVIVA